MDPLRDIDTIDTELVLADLQTVEKRQEALSSGRGRARTPEAQAEAAVLARLHPLLESGQPARALAPLSPADAAALARLQLLTSKPLMFACNVDEISAAAGGNGFSAAVAQHASARTPPAPTVVLCA